MKTCFRMAPLKSLFKRCQYFKLFVSYAGLAIHQWWVTDPKKSFNLRKAAYEPYDANLEVIKRFLTGLGNNKS